MIRPNVRFGLQLVIGAIGLMAVARWLPQEAMGVLGIVSALCFIPFVADTIYTLRYPRKRKNDKSTLFFDGELDNATVQLAKESWYRDPPPLLPKPARQPPGGIRR